MKFGGYAAALAALCLMGAPAVAAPANTASGLSLTKSVRVAAPVAARNKAGTTGIVVAAIAVAAVIAGIVLIADNGDSDSN